MRTIFNFKVFTVCVVFAKSAFAFAAQSDRCRYTATLKVMDTAMPYLYSAYDAERTPLPNLRIAIDELTLAKESVVPNAGTQKIYEARVSGLSGQIRIALVQKQSLVEDEGETVERTQCNVLYGERIGVDE